jgi:biopolymer transport protein ExbD
VAGGTSAYRDEGGESISDINVTPLVDVMLVLLVIFMVTAPLLASRGVTINAPTTVSGEPVTSPLQISLDRAGVVRVNGAVMANDAAASAELARLLARDPALKAVITADTEVAYGDAMRVVDLVKRAGVAKLTLATRRPPRTP